MLAGLEVRVREAEEEAGEGGAREEVGQEFHRVGAQRGDVLIRGGLLGSEGEDARVCEVVHLVADLQACVKRGCGGLARVVPLGSVEGFWGVWRKRVKEESFQPPWLAVTRIRERRTQDQLVRQQRRQSHQQPSKSTAHISHRDGLDQRSNRRLRLRSIRSGHRGGGRRSDVGREIWRPVHQGRVCRTAWSKNPGGGTLC